MITMSIQTLIRKTKKDNNYADNDDHYNNNDNCDDNEQ